MFFEKINIIDKPLAILTKKREKTQITRIRNERGDITTDFTEIKRIIKEYYEQLYTNKLDYWDEMETFRETHELPKLTQEELDNLIRQVKWLN